MMLKLIPYIRKIVWAISFVIALAVIISVRMRFPEEGMQTQQLVLAFAHLALIYLLAALLASPLYIVFPKLPAKPLYIKARKAIGVSAFGFALLHAYYAFFEYLGGFASLKFLDQNYLTAVIIGAVNLLILTVLATTSITILVKKLGRHWKPLHRLVYIVAVMVPIHALLIGTEFRNPDSLYGNLLLFAIMLLLLLEEIRFYKYAVVKFPRFPARVLATILIAIFVSVFYIVFYSNIFIQHGTH